MDAKLIDKSELLARLQVSPRTLNSALATLAILPATVDGRRNLYDEVAALELETHLQRPRMNPGPRPTFTAGDILRMVKARWLALHPGESVAPMRGELRAKMTAELRRHPPSARKAAGVAFSRVTMNQIIESVLSN